MLSAILIALRPTMVTPIAAAARPGNKLTTILGLEGTTADPIGAIIALVVFDEPQSSHADYWLAGTATFAARIAIGLVGVAAGVLMLWLLLKKLKLTGIVATTQASIATVITRAGLCDAPLAKALGLRKPETRQDVGEQPQRS